MNSPSEIRSDSIVHRIGGSHIENLRLKTPEKALVPPGISLFVCDVPEEAADQIRKTFPHAARLLEASRTIASATVEEIRQAGFDVIADPTKRFANHARLIHPEGIAGFTDTHLKRLSAAFEEYDLERVMALDPQDKLYLVDKSGQRLGSVAISRIEGDRVFGRFVADDGFESASSLFERLEAAVNDQLFHEVDRVSDEIEGLGIRLVAEDARDALQLDDVQIMDGTDVSFHVPHLQLTQMASTTATAGA